MAIRIPGFVDKYGSEDKGTLLTKVEQEALELAIADAGDVKTVNSQSPDGQGNVEVSAAHVLRETAEDGTVEEAIAALFEQVAGLAVMQGNWLGQNFDTFAELEAFDQSRPTGFATIPDKTWTRVMDDESAEGGGHLTVYAWFGNVLEFQYVIALDPRNFQTNPVQTNEIANNAINDDKIGNWTLNSPVADESNPGLYIGKLGPLLGNIWGKLAGRATKSYVNSKIDEVRAEKVSKDATIPFSNYKFKLDNSSNGITAVGYDGDDGKIQLRISHDSARGFEIIINDIDSGNGVVLRNGVVSYGNVYSVVADDELATKGDLSGVISADDTTWVD
jgi:hypothetical protein